MAVVINGTNGITLPDGSASAPILNNESDTNNGIFFPDTDVTAITTAGTERMRVDSAGRILVGLTSSVGGTNGAALQVKGLTGSSDFSIALMDNDTTVAGRLHLESTGSNSIALQADPDNLASSTYLGFGVDGTERARITSSGYFKASNDGTYNGSTGSYHELRAGAGDTNLAIFTHTAASPYGPLIKFTTATPNNTTNYFLECSDTTNTKCYIYSSGTISNRTGTYNAISDVKLKQDVVDASSQWNDIKALRIVKYRLKDEVATDPNYPSYIGLIAQEVEQVSPGLVDNCPDFETNEDGERVATGTVTKSVKYSILYMKAVKALQEAMTRIEALEAQNATFEARLAALENK